MAATNVPTVAGFAMMAWCKGIAPRLIGYWLTGFSNATFVLGLSLVSGNTGGQTKKSIASAAVFLGVAAGYVLLAFIRWISRPDQILYFSNIVGPFLFKDNEAPGYLTGIIGCMVSRGLEVRLLSMLLVLPFQPLIPAFLDCHHPHSSLHVLIPKRPP